ncbi:OapA family protein [uncultured Vibrio sp.]|uniref:OapA family protein n=1 Tax=uncultured Vibrio sp. TaxID=114054 RepID=UPI00091E19FA|nr:LysM-like peptidoglycan-binding domain-containing protein [uncultured Vibrio sp.]OIQ24707.1 MAG: lysine transporter LysM [Vibrio sp. MedPE-SWchi]
MNRRKKKPQQTDYIELVRDRVKQIDWQAYKQQAISLWNKLPRIHQRALMFLVPIVFILLLMPSGSKEPSEVVTQTEPNQRVEIAINTQGLSEQSKPQSASPKSDVWSEYTVKTGDTLAKVFRTNGLPMADLNALVQVEGNDKPLSRIKQGQLVRYKLADDGKLDILQLEKSKDSVMFFRLSDGGFGRSK